jgi:hypothetical protein
MISEILIGVQILIWLGVFAYAIWHLTRFRALILNPDGTIDEVILPSDATRFEHGSGENRGLYNIRSDRVFRRMFMGIFPSARIIYFRNYPEPVGWASEKPIQSPESLKLGVGSVELRTIIREERTKALGRPSKPPFPWKMIMIIAIVIIIVIAAWFIVGKMVGGGVGQPQVIK